MKVNVQKTQCCLQRLAYADAPISRPWPPIVAHTPATVMLVPLHRRVVMVVCQYGGIVDASPTGL